MYREVEREEVVGRNDGLVTAAGGVRGAVSGRERSVEAKESRAAELGERLNVDVRVVHGEDGARRGMDAGDGVTVVVSRDADVAEVEHAVVREAVGRKGIDALFEDGAARDGFLDEGYSVGSDAIRAEVDGRVAAMREREVAERTVANGNDYVAMADAVAEVSERERSGALRREAVEDLFAETCAEVGERGYESMDVERLTWWSKVTDLLQRGLDGLMRKLEVPRRVWDKRAWSYVGWRGRKGDGGMVDMAEDAAMRASSGFGGEVRFRDGSLGLEEAITKHAFDLSKSFSDNKELRNEAVRRVGVNLTGIRKAMSAQRHFDVSTVKSVADLARMLMEEGMIDSEQLSQSDIKSLLSAVKNSAGRVVRDAKTGEERVVGGDKNYDDAVLQAV